MPRVKKGRRAGKAARGGGVGLKAAEFAWHNPRLATAGVLLAANPATTAKAAGWAQRNPRTAAALGAAGAVAYTALHVKSQLAEAERQERLDGIWTAQRSHDAAWDRAQRGNPETDGGDVFFDAVDRTYPHLDLGID